MFFLSDNTVMFGTIQSESDIDISISNYYGEMVLEKELIQRIETISSIPSDLELQIILVDGSLIRGTLVDYDEELGLFLNLFFGTLDLPFKMIQEIHADPQLKFQKSKEETETRSGIGFNVLAALNSGNFGLSYNPVLSFDSRIPGVYGLFVGEIVDYIILSSAESDKLQYRIGSFAITLGMEFFPLFSQKPSSSVVSPYLKLGPGVTMISIHDERPNAKNEYYGTINSQALVNLGAGFKFIPHFILFVDGTFRMVFQENYPFLLAGGGISFHYQF